MKKINFKNLIIYKTNIIFVLIVLFSALILGVSLRGNLGVPTGSTIDSRFWKEDGPFELSPERGRFALTYSIAENKSLSFPENIAKFASPDVAQANGKYVSIFAPLLSFIILPGYILGKLWGASQVGTFGMISLFALCNLILLRNIAIKLGAHPLAASIASLVFLFGSPAFAYGVNLYQHHVSTFLMLLSIYALLRFKKIIALLIVFFAFACAIPLDYPNLFFLSPIAIYATLQVFSVQKIRQKFSIKINIYKFLTPIIMVIPILFFLWFNYASYGNPFQLSGTLKNAIFASSSTDITSVEATNELKSENHTKNALGFFRTRNILDGFNIQFISPDRGIIYYTPIVLFGFLGFFLAFKKKVELVGVLAAIVGINILLYSMWGDPWGGWAFGSRYLIPSYAVLAIFIALLLTYWRKKIWFLVVFILVAFYSIAVNVLGAITTSALPPQVQVLELEKISGVIQRYTYQRNWEMLVAGNSKSFVYQEYLKPYLSTVQFYQILTLTIFLIIGLITVYYVYSADKEKNV